MITRKSPTEIDRMRRAGRLVGHTLSTLVETVRPGVTLLELDAQAERVIRDGDGIPSFLGYHGFPATLCLSPNDWIVHGIPNGYVLKDGDILSGAAGWSPGPTEGGSPRRQRRPGACTPHSDRRRAAAR